MRFPLAFLLAPVMLTVQAQSPAGTSVQYHKDQGIVVQHDSTFRSVIRFRMQNRMAFFSARADDLSDMRHEWRTRRARLRFDGFVLTPRLTYKLQFGFTEADMDIQDGSEDQYPLRDALVTYALGRGWSLGLGQAKLPGNRERTISSNQLELPERSILNGAFTLDRDMGLFLNWEGHLGRQLLRLRMALTHGEGRLSAPGSGGLAHTGRVEWLPLGAFKDEGDYLEGDELREERPRLSVAAGYSLNDRTRRANGQLGELFSPGVERTVGTFLADVMFKHRGWSLLSEVAHRTSDGLPAVPDAVEGDVDVVNEGWGLNAQVGRMVGEHVQVVMRYSLVEPSARARPLLRRQEELWLGVSRYIHGHRIKVQSAVIHHWRDGVLELDHGGNRWGLMLQMEVGI